MKKIFCILLIIAAANIQPAEAQEKNLDTMLHKIFRSIKYKDTTSFASLFPNREQMRLLIKEAYGDKYEKEAADSLLEKDFKLDSEENFSKMAKEKFLQPFQDFIKEMEENQNINLSVLSLVGYTIDTLSKDYPKSVKGNLNVSFEGKEYTIKFIDIIWSDHDNGWYGVELRNIISKEELTRVNKLSKPGVKQLSKPAINKKSKPSVHKSKAN